MMTLIGAEYNDLQLAAGEGGRAGSLALERLVLTRENNPTLVTSAREMTVMRRLGVMPGERWNYDMRAKEFVMPNAGNYSIFKHTMAILTAGLDICKSKKSLSHVEGFLHQAYKVTKGVVHSPNHSCDYTWPVLGLPSPIRTSEASWTGAEKAAMAAYRRDQYVLRQAVSKYGSSQEYHARYKDSE
ncbi:unnamed protein product [Polarella glacialis]|uniref:Uncharacterized protein n=1 Tax=Polarella glacialis TaxID=89957 RepID=A0A813I2I5_POLGL|nr:unnamed protein product [Polarella glacialis]